MAVYFVTGKLGAGKSLAAVGRIAEYAAEGRKIAGNLDIYLDKLASTPHSKTTYTRLPDRPTADDLEALGEGKALDDYDEDHNGLLVLDELLTWLNSRSWNDPARRALLDWLLHARKKGWDIIFLCQTIEAVDKQLVDALLEYHVPIANLSKINVPVVGRVWKQFHPSNKPLRLPKIHTGPVMYLDKLAADRWTFRARHLYAAYDTKQVISDSYPHGTYCQLSRWHLEGRYLPPKLPKLSVLELPVLLAKLFIFAASTLIEPRFAKSLLRPRSRVFS